MYNGCSRRRAAAMASVVLPMPGGPISRGESGRSLGSTTSQQASSWLRISPWPIQPCSVVSGALKCRFTPCTWAVLICDMVRSLSGQVAVAFRKRQSSGRGFSCNPLPPGDNESYPLTPHHWKGNGVPMSEKNPSSDRREFLQTTVAAGAALGLASVADADQGPDRGVPTRPLGKTGVNVSIICLGGWHIGSVKDKKEAIKIMHTALDEGLTFFDNAWDYHDGGSEEVMGEALAQDGKRKKCFLMTKNCDRDARGTRQHLEDSLRRLRTDVLDLWQFHEINYDNDPDWIVERGA